MLADASTDLPVRQVLPAVTSALRDSGAAVLIAPPGTGKTTLVPPALAERFAGRIVVAQPRRVAARAAARRMAALLGEPVGATVGYAVRGDRRTGPDTRIEVVTTGLLVQRLQHDPDLGDTDVILLDECHERHLDSDLALAFITDVRAALRPDLRLLAASATVEADRLAMILGTPQQPVPVIRAESVGHPVAIVWAPPGPVDPPYGLRVDPRLLDHVAATVRRALREADGDLLVFLPGGGEIDSVCRRLADLRDRLDLLPLHGRQSSRDQDAALRPGARRRVVLATAVAESSLTVPGVRVVVDAGLSRTARTDLGRGLGALVTVPASQASATQRAGRAGREGPGVVYRCWSAPAHDRLAPYPEPEIAVADLTSFALQLACWGHPDATGLALPDPPPAAALRVARTTLLALGAVDQDGRVTPRGRAIAAVGAHPRLARALLDGAERVGTHRAAEVVALLSDEVGIGGGDDLVANWRRLRSGVDVAATDRWRAEARRLRSAAEAAAQVVDRSPRQGPSARQIGPAEAALPDDLAAGLLVGLAYPERLALVRQPGGTSYLMAGGTAAELRPGSALIGARWLAIAVADRAPGRSGAQIRLATVIDEDTARTAGAALLHSEQEVAWSGDDVVARDLERLGALILADRPPARPERERIVDALLDGLNRVGLSLLSWSTSAHSLRARLAFCRQAYDDPWPEVTDEALLAAARRWLAPELATARRRADLSRVDVAAALRRLLPWPQAARLDELAPERIGVPSGSQLRVDYSDPEAPVLAVKLQETFGWRTAPRLAEGRVPVVLHLLSPAGRPVAVTSDLESFWRTGYAQVRAELRGRYPRHPWPADPTTAVPTRRVQPRRR
ncbi:ATP-dependent helicase HrpB [Micromonospora polyrhachis]|uniref:ATP-dependent helicase HrpB n=1 Tax=Micromonospora polyrhachis TaxID=1282883 RepID=A0A7W7SKU7_9ACTN|nr:ATP-dependent helicase HrpB [Micromonospora polyrhachis]MBB4956654.1 ATP-dependent helicase HrpB [Micromonospora polyrhachis]